MTWQAKEAEELQIDEDLCAHICDVLNHKIDNCTELYETAVN